MKTYIVNTLSIGGRRNRIFKSGDIVTEHDFMPGHAEILRNSGHLRYEKQPKPIIGVLIITRGDRPEFLNHAKYLLSQQTLTPDHILIFDEQPKSNEVDITYRYRKGTEILKQKGCEAIVFWEDDDWYRYDYLEKMVSLWQANGCPDIFGLNSSIYYHIHVNKFLRITHKNRASMMSTMINANAKIKWCDDNYAYTDMILWKQLKGVAINYPQNIALGIKHGTGLCGGGGHTTDWSRYNENDEQKTFLKNIVDGLSFQFYTEKQTRIEVVTYKKNAFLSIVTRRYTRPLGFANQQKSIKSLTDKSIEQVFIYDHVGLGMLAANKSFAEVKDIIKGEYVFLLDDDDFIVNPNMVSELKQIHKEHNPDVICFRMTIKNNMNNNHYPTEHVWGKAPKIAHIGGSCFVVKREIYQKFIHHFGVVRCGDFYFINEVYNSGAKFYWHDVLMAETGKVSKGAAE